jgi:hypothetical protein
MEPGAHISHAVNRVPNRFSEAPFEEEADVGLPFTPGIG